MFMDTTSMNRYMLLVNMVFKQGNSASMCSTRWAELKGMGKAFSDKTDGIETDM